MHKSFVYRLYPNKTQSSKMSSLLDIAREIYNAALQERIEAYKKKGISLSFFSQSYEIKEIRSCIPDVAQLNASVMIDILRRLDKNYKSFFRRVKNNQKPGFPRYKGYNRFNSFTFPHYGNGVKLKNNRLYIQNVGLVKIKVHRILEGEIEVVAIKRIGDKWYAIFSNSVEIEPLSQSDKQIGIDVGIESFAVTSDREFIENPHYFKDSQAKLRIAQRKVARRKKGGSNRRKAVKLLAKQHLKIANQRKDFAHKLSRRLVDNYGYIAVEDLSINNMVKNHHLAGSISDVGWGKFLDILAYKAEWAGRQFVKVNPNGTSQICSRCGVKVPKDLSVRVHECPDCGLVLHRDVNAAINIRTLGRSVWDVTCRNTESVSQEAISVS